MSSEVEFQVFPSDTSRAFGGGEVFGPRAFEGQVGKEIPVGTTIGTLIAATVAPDGSSATLRLRVSDEAAKGLQPEIREGDYSFDPPEAP